MKGAPGAVVVLPFEGDPYLVVRAESAEDEWRLRLWLRHALPALAERLEEIAAEIEQEAA